MVKNARIEHFWTHYAAYFLLLAFISIFTALLVAKHEAFNTRVYDFARFSQAIWNTQDGRFLFTSITNGSILGNHFSPIMAIATPLVWLFQDERVLFFIQVVNVAVASYILYLIFKRHQPRLAPLFLLIILLNPALHEATLFEFRRIVFALPFLALALYALANGQRKLMLISLIFALLAKENIGFFVFMIGVYLILFERDWKWGVGLVLLGFSWVVVISIWVIPFFNTSSTAVATDTYPQLYYFDFLGSSYEEIAQTLLSDPLIIARQMFQPTQVTAVFRILLPLGILLPFIKPEWLIFCLPYLGILLLSNDIDMIRIEKWYPATILMVLFAATAVGWNRIPSKWRRGATVWLLTTTLIGFFFYSPAPGGGKYEAQTYQISSRDKLGRKLLKTIPQEANVAAQGLYIPHLTRRSELYIYPWITIGPENIDYFVLDNKADPYPMDAQLLEDHITNFVSDPANIVVQEADDIFIISNGTRETDEKQWPSFAIDHLYEDSLYLERIEVAVADESAIYQTQTEEPLIVENGQQLRVTLYWEAMAPIEFDRTISVRVAKEDGALLAQHDGLPANGRKPTSWWEAGWYIRDVHYFELPTDAPTGEATLELVLYDTYSLERVAISEDKDDLTLVRLIIE